MVVIEIPGKGVLRLENLLIDLNGTLATDWVIVPKIKEKINALSRKLKIFILSADTLGTLKETTKGIKADLIRVSGQSTSRKKAEVFHHVEPSKTAVIGNGHNDLFILKEARIGIAVIGHEGASVKALLASDIVVKDIADALELFMHPVRITATLRG
jgi:soluble P-type ATPase